MGWLWCLLLLGCQPEVPRERASLATEVEQYDMAPALAQKYKRTMIRNAEAVWGPNAPVALFGAQVEQESSWNPEASSPVGATGLAQFMPATARDVSQQYPDELGANQPANPDWALRALVRYDKQLFDQVHYSRECDRAGAMLSSYNGGLGWHNRRKAKAANPDDFWTSVRLVNPGLMPVSQTENEAYPVRIVQILQPRYGGWGRMEC